MRILFPLMLLVAAGYWLLSEFVAPQTPVADAAAVYAGHPVSVQAGDVQLLENSGFLVGYSESRKSPLWVAFSLRPVSPGRLPPRPRFERDPRSRAGVDHGDLRHGDYDRGHLAPNYAMSRLYGETAQRESFLMTNIVPQRPRLNQLLWQRIEESEIDVMTRLWGQIRVITGPVFDPPRETLPSGVEVADAFYRVWLDITDAGEPRMLALIVAQTVNGDEALSDFVTTVDEVERRTGLDFYPQLTQAEQARLESQPADLQAWEIGRIACRPARYHDDWQAKNGIQLRYDRCQK